MNWLKSMEMMPANNEILVRIVVVYTHQMFREKQPE